MARTLLSVLSSPDAGVFQLVRSPRASSLIILLVILCFGAATACAETPSDSVARIGSDSVDVYPSNAQIVRRNVASVARKIFDGFPFVRPKPMWITPATGEPRNFWLEESAARELFERGYIVQESPGEDTATSGLWAVRYRFDRFSLSLPQCARHSFLGRIWVQRKFDLSLQLQVWDMESGQLLWSNSGDGSCSDWVPKRKLKELSDPGSTFLSPVPPVTTMEKLAEPALVIAAAGALTVLFFVVR
ncbi:MAG: hypothetical protein HZB43_06050 [candidate division Zixibacteria bacterium]|nr:hypothetical protein [candidate division Zixibacteria bacterium]